MHELRISRSTGDVEVARELVEFDVQLLGAGKVGDLIRESGLSVSFTALGKKSNCEDKQASLGHFDEYKASANKM